MLWNRMSFHVIFWRSTVLRVLATSPSSPCLGPAGRRASGHLKSPNRFGCSQNLWQRGKDMMLKNWMHLSDQELVARRLHLNRCWPTPTFERWELRKRFHFWNYSLPRSIPRTHSFESIYKPSVNSPSWKLYNLHSSFRISIIIWDEVLWSCYDRTRLILIHNIHIPMPSSVDTYTINIYKL